MHHLILKNKDVSDIVVFVYTKTAMLLSCRGLELCTTREEYILRVSESKGLIKQRGMRWVGLTAIYDIKAM